MGNVMKIFSGNANYVMAEEIAEHLELMVSEAEVRKFSDGEIFIEIKENVRGTDSYIIQPTCTPVNDHLMELVIMADALRRASARRITAVIPYYGYARQDRKVAPRVPISAKVVAEMLMAVGVRRVLCMDLHAGQIQGFFNIPVDHLYAAPVLIKYIKEHFDDFIMISPDAGGVERTRAFAKRLNCGLAIIDKRRDRPNQSEAMPVPCAVGRKPCCRTGPGRFTPAVPMRSCPDLRCNVSLIRRSSRWW
jgi:ribose-phosphate pyrophosphokinase